MSTMSTQSNTVPFAVGSAESQTVTLPPISSFDNLIRAAEEQYTLQSSSSTSPTLPAREQFGNIFSYQLSGSASATNSMDSSAGGSGSSTGVGGAAVVGGVPHSSEADESSENLRSGHVSDDTSDGEHVSHASLGHVGLALNSSHLSESPQTHSTLQRSLSVDSIRIGKPRRKKECPVCHHFYANLSTHKSTHLTPENRPHKCPICFRGFARNNDLLRHRKRHWKDEIIGKPEPATVVTTTAKDVSQEQLKSLHQIKGTFKCPFNSTLIGLDMEMYPHKKHELMFETSNCHQTGVFSRCDTFKNHLKALHFEYPPGTKKKDRATVHGRCKHCGGKFANVDEWLNEHVGKTCGYSYH